VPDSTATATEQSSPAPAEIVGFRPERKCCPTCGAVLEPAKGNSKKYAFERLEEIGQQLFLPLDFSDPKAVIRVRGAANTFGDNRGWRFTVRTVEGGARVKRVA